MAKNGRPKKTDSQTLVKLTEDFFASEGHGDPSCLKCTRLAAYAQKHGIEAHDYDFRRDQGVKDKIEELKDMPSVSTDTAISAYRTLDIEGLLRSCSDLNSLRRKLGELDSYWHEIHEKAAAVQKENAALHKSRSETAGKNERLKKEVEAGREENAGITSENRRLKAENAWLRKQIRDFLYPALANELLAQAGLPNEKSDDIKPEAVEEMIEGNTPSPFDGRQGSFEDGKTRLEQLEEQMKAQVRDGKQ